MNMKKSLIALAVAGVFTAPAAMADVTVYGVANVSVDMTNTGSGTVPGVAPGTRVSVPGFSGTMVSSNTSRLGVKGNEDLGNGLTAVWQIESLVHFEGGKSTAPGAAQASTLATRNTFVGLSSSAGTVLLGRHDTPYKISTRAYDLFGDTIADNRSIMGGGLNTVSSPIVAANGLFGGTGAGASFDGRQTDVIAYVSPAVGGFTGIAAVVLGAEGQTNANQSKGSAFSLAGLYGAGPISASIAYEKHTIGNAPGSVGILGLPVSGLSESALKLGAGYKADAFEVNAVYERTSDTFGGVAALGTAGLAAGSNVLGHSAFYLSGKANLGSGNALKLAYAKAGNMNVGGIAAASANTGASQVTVGFDHSFTKRTTLYALYTKLSNDANQVYQLGNAGIGNGIVYQNGMGAKPSTFSLGMKHSF
jgi:predicted porin